MTVDDKAPSVANSGEPEGTPAESVVSAVEAESDEHMTALRQLDGMLLPGAGTMSAFVGSHALPMRQSALMRALPQLRRPAASSHTNTTAGLIHDPTGPVEIAPPGTRVGQYEIIRAIGSGGMGQVYLARDTHLGRRVALKFLMAHDDSVSQRFLREAQATASFSHENIVTIYEVGEYQGHPFMALEYIEGETLHTWLAERRERHHALLRDRGAFDSVGAGDDGVARPVAVPIDATLPPVRAAELMIPVVRALVVAHRAGIVHRDLKPANIMLGDDGAVKVLDFGIAKVLRDDGGDSPGDYVTGPVDDDAITRAGAIIGTLPYMSPEQLRGDDIDHRTDIWAVGIILHYMVTGRHPLAPLSRDKLDRVSDMSEAMPLVSDLRPDLGALGAIVDRCLIKQADDRTGSAEELLTDLETVGAGRSRTALDEDQSPFIGLAAFQGDDHRRFFGREDEIFAMVAELRYQRLVAIIGPSGAGKSSFVRAGLIPALERSGDGWDAFTVRPGRHPLTALADVFGRLSSSTQSATGDGAVDQGYETEEFVAMLRTQPGRLGTQLRARCRKRRRRTLVFIDQFEELYTVCNDPEERASFAACLEGIADDAASPLRVVLTVRSDFLDRVADDRATLPTVARALSWLPSIGRAGLRAALTRPVELAGYRFESEDEVEHMLDTLQATRAPLPLLQFTAGKLWDMRDRERRLLTRESHRRLGGVAGALATHAEGVMDSFSSREQKLARLIFLHLVTPERTRAMVSMAELREIEDESHGVGGDDEVEQLVEHLAASRLVLLERGEDGASDGATVELVHESLIASWPRLARWLEENHEDADFLARLHSAAKQWESSERAEGLLWRGDAAHDAERWLERWRERGEAGQLSKRGERYLEAVVALAHRARVRRKRATAGSFAALVVVAVVVAVLAVRAEQKAAGAKREAARADMASAAAEEAASLARRDALAARNATRVAAAREMQSDPTRVLALLREVEPGELPRGWSSLSRWALHTGLSDVIYEHPTLMASVAFSPDGDRVVTAGGDGVVRVWQADRDASPLALRGHEQAVVDARFSPDGRRIASASSDYTVRVWRADGSGAPIVLQHHDDVVNMASFSPDGRRLVTASSDHTAHIVAADGTGEPTLLIGHEDRVLSAQFSADGTRIATASEDGTVRLWSAIGDGPPAVLRGHQGPVFTAEFSPDDRRVLSASFDQTARIWNADGTGTPTILDSDGIRLYAASFSPDGNRVMAVGTDRYVRIFDAHGQRQPVILRGHRDWIYSAAYSADGRAIATTSSDKSTRIWRVIDRPDPLVLRGHTAHVNVASFSPDGEYIVSGSLDRTARVWRADGAGKEVVLQGHEGSVMMAAFDHTGTRVVTASGDTTVRIWNADGSGTPVVVGEHENQVGSALFSPDGTRVVTTSFDDVVRVWNADGTGEPVRLVGHEGPVFSAAFSSDGSQILTASNDGTARIWRADGTGDPVVLEHGKTFVASAAFSRDGRLVATTTEDFILTIWEVREPGASPQRLQTLSHNERILVTDTIYGGAFSPDQRRVITSSDDSTALIWDLESGEHVALYGHEGSVWRAVFSPDGSKVVTASADDTVRVWSDFTSLTLEDPRLWRASRYCMPVAWRMEYLGVSEEAAQENREVCRRRVEAVR